MGKDKPSPVSLAASRVRLQCLGESTDGEVKIQRRRGRRWRPLKNGRG